MKVFFFILIIGLAALSACNKPEATAVEELMETGHQLKEIDHVAYTYEIKYTQSYEPDTGIYEGQIYFEAAPSDTAWGYRFHREGRHQKSFYNGEYIIFLNQKDSTARKKPFCDYEDGHMTGYPYLNLSLAAIANFLSDTLFRTGIDSLTRTDTLVDGAPCDLYTFWAESKLVDIYKLFQKDQKLIKLALRKEDHMPVFYSQYHPIPQKNAMEYLYHEVHFRNFSFKQRLPSHQFSIEKVPSFYDWDWMISLANILPLQTTAPDWKLPLVQGDSLSLSSLKGKYVLLDFWFIGCGACVQSIPTLNALMEKYDRSRFEVIGVNFSSKDHEAIQKYCMNADMKYRNVWQGDMITDDYRIKAAPIFYLINPEGLIVYSQIGHDEESMISNIARVME